LWVICTLFAWTTHVFIFTLSANNMCAFLHLKAVQLLHRITFRASKLVSCQCINCNNSMIAVPLIQKITFRIYKLVNRRSINFLTFISAEILSLSAVAWSGLRGFYIKRNVLSFLRVQHSSWLRNLIRLFN
jgi:hypothetical protein